MAGRFATSPKLPRLDSSSDGLFILACARGVNENERWYRNARCDAGRAGRRASNTKCLIVFMLVAAVPVKRKVLRHRRVG